MEVLIEAGALLLLSQAPYWLPVERSALGTATCSVPTSRRTELRTVCATCWERAASLRHGETQQGADARVSSLARLREKEISASSGGSSKFPHRLFESVSASTPISAATENLIKHGEWLHCRAGGEYRMECTFTLNSCIQYLSP